MGKLKPEFALCALGNLDETEAAKLMDTGLYVMEAKLDGVRVMVQKDGNQTTIRTRNGIDYAPKFPGIVDQVKRSPHSKLILDGELVSPNLRFADVTRALQSGNPAASGGIGFVVFDVLYSNNHSHINSNYMLRHTILREICDTSPLCYLPNHEDLAHFSRPMDLYDYQLANGHEGVVIKKRDAIYTPGRSKNFLRSKFKNTLSVMPIDVTGERTISCGVWTGNGSEAVVVCNLLVPDDDLVLMLNQNLSVVLEIEAYGVSATGKLRHPVYKGMRFDVDLQSCTLDQLDALRLY